MVGWSDLPADLSDTAKIARVSAALPAGVPIISSDLIRTIATADALATGRDRLSHDPDLREMHFGAWEQRAFAEIEAEDPERIAAFWFDLTARVNRAVDRLLALERPLVVVAHFGVILTQIERVTGISTEEAFGHWIEPLSITTLRYGATPEAVQINHEP